tara:strand:- start:185 stop:382 length:198 start_codon:yes stop_codon:yes gene_type:complete
MLKFKEDFLDKVGSKEIKEIAQLLDKVEKFGLTVEVVYYALRTIKENKCITPLLALQIAMEDWDC